MTNMDNKELLFSHYEKPMDLIKLQFKDKMRYKNFYLPATMPQWVVYNLFPHSLNTKETNLYDLNSIPIDIAANVGEKFKVYSIGMTSHHLDNFSIDSNTQRAMDNIKARELDWDAIQSLQQDVDANYHRYINQSKIGLLPNEIAIGFMVSDCTLRVIKRFKTNDFVFQLINYIKDFYNLTVEIMANGNLLDSHAVLSNYKDDLLKARIKKKKTNNVKKIHFEKGYNKLTIEEGTEAKHIRNRMRDLFDKNGYLHKMNSPTPLELNELLGTALTNYVYVNDGDIYGHSKRRTISSLPRCGVKLKNSFVIGCLNCNGLSSSMAGIDNLLKHSNIDLLILLETMTRENKPVKTQL